MRSTVLIFFLLLFSIETFSQAPVLAVNRVDKRTNEHIRQTSMYLFKDGGDVTKLSFSIRALDDTYFLLLNLPIAATVKRGTEVSLIMDNGQIIKLISNNDVISLNEADISKRMMVFDLEPDNEIKELLKQPVKSISIPTSNKGTVVVSLLAKDKGLIRSGIMLAQKK
ncbi:hypothetical protein [Daejeonella sp.]|uniref:hypothetical protein n=1 Tax=Daejeonella sp. TaxID=2805397 RepID=UPI002725C885|nr:hypothetical protein [Daejeonella sp.]MDO8991459.1 hypothetical protein [Daejeonella sp.]MDP2412304.1 hypothetical protein [Daejeonella sp.]